MLYVYFYLCQPVKQKFWSFSDLFFYLELHKNETDEALWGLELQKNVKNIK